MRREARIAVIIPALNEEGAIGRVLEALPAWVDQHIVVDNGSTDATADVARTHGAHVVHEPRRGYGAACLAGIAALDAPDIVVFLDGDFSDCPSEMDTLVDPILDGAADMVIGSRATGKAERGALTPHARFGNWLATRLLRLFWGVAYTDLGPFRAIRHSTLHALAMQDRDFGWTVEMQVKAARRGFRGCEVPVSYRRRIGQSKISGTLKGVIAAGTKILYTIGREAVRASQPRPGLIRERLILFTRYPEAGRTKTRLIPALGPEGAATLQRTMTAYITATARATRTRLPLLDLEIRFAGGTAEAMTGWLGAGPSYREQSGADLGARMHNAFRNAFFDGMDRVVIIGSDCPAVSENIIKQAMKALKEHAVVPGPATDGGYYLIGLARPFPELFDEMPWGSETVLERTLERAQARRAQVFLLPELRDIDRPEDLDSWNRIRNTSTEPEFSVIVPALDEERYLADTLAAARGPGTELIVVDGGSTDQTRELAATYGARLIDCEPGRAAQMNAGARTATGRILLFLHADTILPPDYADAARAMLNQADVAMGAFPLRIDAPGAVFRAIESVANMRARWFGLPYGDQALFMTRTTYETLGGFPELAVMEDFALVRRVRRTDRIAVADIPLVTSARRWLRRGPLRLTLLHQAMILAYLLGVPPHRLAAWREGRPR